MPKLTKSAHVVKWSDDEVFKLLKANPKMVHCTKNAELADAIVRAQNRNALPKERHRDRDGLVQTLGRADRGQSPLKEQMKKAFERLQKEQAEAATTPAEPKQPHANAGQAIVRWHMNEWTRLAHDEEVKGALAGSTPPTDRALCDILLRAQRRQLPRDRQRMSKSIYQTMRSRTDGKNKARGALDTLREAIKYQPKEPIVSIHAPMPQYPESVEPEDTMAQSLAQAQEETVREGVQRAQAEQAAAAPFIHINAPQVAHTSGLGAALANLITVAIGQLRTGIMESVNAGIDAAMTQALTDATAQLKDANVQAIADLLGGTTTAAGPSPKAEPITAKTEPKTRGLRVDVVGLLNGQVEQVRKAAGAAFDLRFFTPEELDRQELTAPVTVMLANQVPHRSRHQIQSRGGRLVWANGGISGVLRELSALQH